MLKLITSGKGWFPQSWYYVQKFPLPLTAFNHSVSKAYSTRALEHRKHHWVVQQMSTSTLLRLNTPVIQAPGLYLHESRTAYKHRDPRDSFTAQSPTTTHVFRIKSNVPEEASDKVISIRNLVSIPGPYMIYGLGGLIPFMSAPYYMHLVNAFSPGVAHAQLVYGACILSFLGGVSWGDHLRRPIKASIESLRYSILLPLVAWPAVLLYPNPGSFVVMIGGIIYAGLKDMRSESYPGWFKSLRLLLTTLVALSLSTTLVFSFTKEVRERRGEEDKDTDDECNN